MSGDTGNDPRVQRWRHNRHTCPVRDDGTCTTTCDCVCHIPQAQSQVAVDRELLREAIAVISMLANGGPSSTEGWDKVREVTDRLRAL